MQWSDLEHEYDRLRQELERAYAAPVWNSRQIDRITDAIARIERTFMRRLGCPSLVPNPSRSPSSSCDLGHA
jgi:hypothetical protein